MARTFSVHAAALHGGGTRGRRVLLVLRDVTQAREIERMRVDFIANVSHELRTPLSSVLGFIETLQGPARDDGEARERFLEIMAAEAGRMARIVEDLLSFSQVEINEHIRPTTPYDIVVIAREAVDALASQAEARDIAVEIEAAAAPLIAPADRDQIHEVFVNLLDNAIKYGRQGGHVRIRINPVARFAETGGAGIAVAVSDDGEGIAEEDIPRLTERFYRVDKGRSRALGGTGLGLAIVKHIVARHRGRMKIESELGKGSTFTVTLPAVADATAS